MQDTLKKAHDWHAAGRAVAIATVVETWGSAPRPAGSVMACNDDGEFVGSVSGGCVEVAVIESAQDVLRGAAARVLEFGVSDEQAWAVGLACGGRIRVLVEVMRPALVADLLAADAAAKPVVVASALDGSRALLIGADSADVQPGLLASAALAVRSDTAQRLLLDGCEWLLTPHNPPLRLIVIGAVHIAEALCAIALITGHGVTLIDPRSAFLRPTLFPGVTLSDRWPQQVLPELALDARCAAVLLTHDPKIDDPAIEVLLRSPVYYIGALGSRRTHARRMERLQAAGHAPEALARVRGPAGLSIGARSPAEIALSILAEMTQALRLTEGQVRSG